MLWCAKLGAMYFTRMIMLVFIINLWDRSYFYPYFSNMETKAQTG